MAGRMLKFASPLQSLTIPDPEVVATSSTKRQQFLSRFKAGLQAETAARRDIASKRTRDLQKAATSENWAEKAKGKTKDRRLAEERLVEEAYDKAVAAVSTNEKKMSSSSPNKYQFVGVVQRGNSDKPISWYARPKPVGSKWSVRLIHVNRDAIIQDLFKRGKVDIFAKYKNTGRVNEETNTPIVTGKYEAKERSWRTLWNFSPKHFFTDPSGMYWRERRLRSGLYTDGVSVYETSYRYSDGRNGMHRVSGFQQFLASKAVKEEQKERILKRLKEAEPDVVLEL